MALAEPHISLILIGGGGHCRSCLEVLHPFASTIAVRGILDPNAKVGSLVMGIPILGDDDEVEHFAASGIKFLVTLGQVGSSDARRKLYERSLRYNAKFPVVIATDAYVAASAHIGQGSIIMHQAFVNCQVRLGVNCIINSRALIEHDAEIGDHCHVATGAIINGGCQIGAGSFIGSGAIILQGIHIAAGTVVGAGSVVTKNITKSGVYCGSPARPLLPTS